MADAFCRVLLLFLLPPLSDTRPWSSLAMPASGVCAHLVNFGRAASASGDSSRLACGLELRRIASRSSTRRRQRNRSSLQSPRRIAARSSLPQRSSCSSQTVEGTWCSGITSASHAEGPGFNPQCVHLLRRALTFSLRARDHAKPTHAHMQARKQQLIGITHESARVGLILPAGFEPATYGS